MAMLTISAEVAVTIGAIVGALSTLASTWLAHILSSKRENSLDDKRRARLKMLLSGKRYKWRNIKTLSASIGADEIKTAELLLEIDARASLSNNSSWGLISRNPYPQDVQPKA